MRRFSCLSAAVLATVTLASAVPGQAPAPKAPAIYFVDVEGGAATLIVTPAGESILIDSGWPREDGRDAKRIEQVARYTAGLTQIDHYLTTHWHTDHYGGIEALAKLMPVKHYWDRGIPAMASDKAEDFPTLMAAYKRANGGKSAELQPGDRIPLRQAGVPIELKVLAARGKVVGEGSKGAATTCSKHGEAPAKDESDNMLSLALLFRYGNFQFLNCGDLTWAIEHKLSCPKNRIGDVDVWQVTHHGWQASGNPALVEATQPRCAVMVNGARKGASPSVVRLCKTAPSIRGFFQLHKALENAPEDNTSADRIANLEEKCNAEFFTVRLSEDGRQYTVFKGSDKPLQTFDVK